jgi:hypothetical protein
MQIPPLRYGMTEGRVRRQRRPTHPAMRLRYGWGTHAKDDKTKGERNELG